MLLKTITGLMARRLLINWRIPLHIAKNALPTTVRPSNINGHAIAGLCIVRLENMRIPGLPSWTGLASENLAVRMGVEWDTPTGLRKAVLIFRRETNSPINALLGKHIHFGVHHPGKFSVQDDGQQIRAAITGVSHPHWLSLHVRPATRPAYGSIFEHPLQAETFFRGGECGYSPASTPGIWDGINLHLDHWDLQRLDICEARSTLIEDLFDGHARVDSAFIMRNIQHTWSALESLPLGPARIPLHSLPTSLAHAHAA